MHRVFIPLLLLGSVAITSTTPLLSASKLEATPDDDGQHTDNTFSHSNNIKNVLQNIIYKMPDDTSRYESPEKKSRYGKANNGRSELSLDDFIRQEQAHNDEGFRKEQWHNYPRRLDRLQDYTFSSKNHINQESDEYDKHNILGQHKKSRVSDETDTDVKTNEFVLDSRENPLNIYDTIYSDTNPVLILKIRLAYLKNQYKNIDEQKYDDNLLPKNSALGRDNLKFGFFADEMGPAAKVKREGVILEDYSSDGDQAEKKTVKKRLFSLWSRLQSLSPKGHELPHRRHLAFYSIPEASAGADAALNTQTRALMRPPGSPLRWG